MAAAAAGAPGAEPTVPQLRLTSALLHVSNASAGRTICAMKNRLEAKVEQQRRLSAALRENLKRRKAQAKGRSAAERTTGERRKSHDSAGIPADKDAPEPR